LEPHTEWRQQIEADLDGELSLAEQAALARHLATCNHCAGARASHLELRVALAQASGEPQAPTVPRPAVRGRALARSVAVAVIVGLAAGWVLHATFGGPGGGNVEDVRAAIMVR
jgi:anti-sigma factor RsiW